MSFYRIIMDMILRINSQSYLGYKVCNIESSVRWPLFVWWGFVDILGFGSDWFVVVCNVLFTDAWLLVYSLEGGNFALALIKWTYSDT